MKDFKITYDPPNAVTIYIWAQKLEGAAGQLLFPEENSKNCIIYYFYGILVNLLDGVLFSEFKYAVIS